MFWGKTKGAHPKVRPQSSGFYDVAIKATNAKVTTTATISPPYLGCRVKVWVGYCRVPRTRVVKVLAVGNIAHAKLHLGTRKRSKTEADEKKPPPHARAYEVVHSSPFFRTPPTVNCTGDKSKCQGFHLCCPSHGSKSPRSRRATCWKNSGEPAMLCSTVPYSS